MVQLMSLPTQLLFLNRCARSACFFLGVIHKIFQANLGTSYPSMPRLSKVVRKYYLRLHAARGYRVKLHIQHDVRQIIYIYNHEKLRLNRLVWGSLMLTPITPCAHRCLQNCVGTQARLGYAAFDAQLRKAYFVITLWVFASGSRDMSTHDSRKPGQCLGMPGPADA